MAVGEVVPEWQLLAEAVEQPLPVSVTLRVKLGEPVAVALGEKLRVAQAVPVAEGVKDSVLVPLGLRVPLTVADAVELKLTVDVPQLEAVAETDAEPVLVEEAAVVVLCGATRRPKSRTRRPIRAMATEQEKEKDNAGSALVREGAILGE